MNQYRCDKLKNGAFCSEHADCVGQLCKYWRKDTAARQNICLIITHLFSGLTTQRTGGHAAPEERKSEMDIAANTTLIATAMLAGEAYAREVLLPINTALELLAPRTLNVIVEFARKKHTILLYHQTLIWTLGLF